MTNPFAYDPAPVAQPAQQPMPAPTAPAFVPPAPHVPNAYAAATSGAPAGGGYASAAVATADPFGGADPFATADPAPQAPRSPRFRELYGRLLILVPKRLEKGLTSGRFKNPDGSPVMQDRLTADLIVLDGPTIHYGGEPEKIPPVPHDKTAEPPCKWPDTFISFTGIISQCRNALTERAAGRPGLVIGRLTKGQDSGKGNPPWLLAPATDADKALGRRYLASVDPFA